MRDRTPELLYVLNLALITTHQVDAAFWHEWDVFGVPGGLPFFLVFNFIAVAFLAYGAVVVATRRQKARLAALLCAGVCLLTVVIHALFFFVDPVAFWTPMSIAILAALAVTSGLQIFSASRLRTS